MPKTIYMVRVRIAPSPTGYVHIGTLRSILYNYIFARQNNGKFICRIEDTDQERYVEDAMDTLYEAMDWIGLKFDEGPKEGGDYGPYIQTQRTKSHLEVATKLIEMGHAYKCFCTQERLAEMRGLQEKLKKPTGYDGKCRDLKADEKAALEKSGTPYSIRLKMPKGRKIIVNDAVRGKVEFWSDSMDDHIIFKSDGISTAQLAIPVDDHFMGITHVLRGEEWLPSAPRQVLIFELMGWDVPRYAHLPLILKPDGSGKKISKRDGGAVVSEYINEGFLPEAAISFLPMLGWNPGTPQDIFTLDDLIKQFSLDKIQKAGAAFDRNKFEWVNGQFIRKLTPEDLTRRIKPFIEKQIFYKKLSDDLLVRLVKELQPRMKTLKEGAESARWFFELPEYDIVLFNNEKFGVDRPMALKTLTDIKTIVDVLADCSAENLKLEITKYIESNKLSNGLVLWPLRVAVTGLPSSPGAYESAGLLGKSETLKRLELAIKKLTK